MLALHGAGSPGGAQFYMECAQINVVGGTGTKTPSSTVSFPGAYKVRTLILVPVRDTCFCILRGAIELTVASFLSL